jgi:hypothetical protein
MEHKPPQKVFRLLLKQKLHREESSSLRKDFPLLKRKYSIGCIRVDHRMPELNVQKQVNGLPVFYYETAGKIRFV